jgi:hypothetical protein
MSWLGKNADSRPVENDVVAPRDINEFILGRPFTNALNPSLNNARPGPRIAIAPRAPPTAGVPNQDINSEWAY